MLYKWVGRKPLHRTHNVLATTGRGRGKPIGIETHDVCYGETFAPSEAEVVSFGDLMEQVGASLAVASAAPETVDG